MNKFIGVILGVMAVGVLGYATYSIIDGNNKMTDFNKYDFASIIEPTVDNGNIGDHVKGSKDAPVVIVEYADFQCSGCAGVNPKVNKLIEKMNGKLAIVYRNFLLSYHQNATAAASAAEAAGLQGYWKPYTDMLFAKQDEWFYDTPSERTEHFAQYFVTVTEGEGDMEKFNTDITSAEVSKKISFDMGIGKRIDIDETPAFYIDGEKITWGDQNGGSITVNGELIEWSEPQSTEEKFIELFTKIVSAKLK